jgi:iron-only hydrogenase group A
MSHLSNNDSGFPLSDDKEAVLLLSEQENKEKKRVCLTIDNRNVEVDYGTTILAAANQLGIDIPTLCSHSDLCISGLCRVCVVEVQGMPTLKTACDTPITEPIKVFTHSRKVLQARSYILDLLISKHYGDCYDCGRNNNCELPALAEQYSLAFLRFGKPAPHVVIDHSSYAITRDMNKCIYCQRCVHTCKDLQEVGCLAPVGRGKNIEIATFLDKPLGEAICINCGQCVERCPTGALQAKDAIADVRNAIEDPNKHVVIQTAPAPRAAIGEYFGLEPGHALTFEMNTALRQCGFDKVFDTNFSADLTIIEEGSELIKRLYQVLVEKDTSISLPQFTSCSPGWIKYLEHFYPEFIPNLSTAKSPQQMFGAVIKTYYAGLTGINPEDIVTVALMPCTAKKFECNRPEMVASGFKDVDYALTTQEVARMFKNKGINLPKMVKSDFDDPFGMATGSGVIFGATGGVMEAALRTVIELVTGELVETYFEHADIQPVRGMEGVRKVEVKIPKTGIVPDIIKNVVPDLTWLKGVTLKLAVVHGTANARKVLENIKVGGELASFHFIEFMACPGGCLGGGGQPVPTSESIRQARARAIYSEDNAYTIRKSHQNPSVLKLYRDFLVDGPGSHLSHELLHTTYIPRGKMLIK